jgi:uncharacterized membrane protein
MPVMKGSSLLHGTFRTGITLKGIGGLIEAAGGVLIWFVGPARLAAFVQGLLEREEQRNPYDFISAHFLHLAHEIGRADPVFASLYLLSHGIVKTVLVIALWFNKLWAYPVTLVVFGGFMIYQMRRYTHTHSFALVMLTIFDAVVVWLTWQEWRVQRKAPEKTGAPGGSLRAG